MKKINLKVEASDVHDDTRGKYMIAKLDASLEDQECLWNT